MIAPDELETTLLEWAKGPYRLSRDECDVVIAYVHTHKRYKALTDDEKMRAALEVLVGDAFASKGWAAVALPEDGE